MTKRDECERVVRTILRDFDPTADSRTLAAEIVAAVFEELKKRDFPDLPTEADIEGMQGGA